MATRPPAPSKSFKKKSPVSGKKIPGKKRAAAKQAIGKAKSAAKQTASRASSLKSKFQRTRKKVVGKVKELIQKAEKLKDEALAPLRDEDATASEILRRLREALSPSHLSLQNLSAAHRKHAEARKRGGGHYSVSVVSEVFSGLDLRARQRWVMNLLSDQMGKAIHALQMDLRSPEEVPLSKDSGAPLRRDLKIKPDRPGTGKKTARSPLPAAEEPSDKLGTEDDDF